MAIQFLLDENIDVELAVQLRRHVPELEIRLIGVGEAPAKRSIDPLLLRWCEQHGFLLITENRRTMPRHLADHLLEGRHMPGILAWRKGASMGRVLEHLILIALAADEGEFTDQIVYLPFDLPHAPVGTGQQHR